MIVQSLITVKLESPDGDAVFKIRRPKKNVYYQFTSAIRSDNDTLKAQAYDDFVKAMCQNVVEVENITLDTGEALTPNQFHALDVDAVLVEQLAVGYIASLNTKASDVIEKKDSTNELKKD